MIAMNKCKVEKNRRRIRSNHGIGWTTRGFRGRKSRSWGSAELEIAVELGGRCVVVD